MRRVWWHWLWLRLPHCRHHWFAHASAAATTTMHRHYQHRHADQTLPVWCQPHRAAQTTMTTTTMSARPRHRGQQGLPRRLHRHCCCRRHRVSCWLGPLATTTTHAPCVGIAPRHETRPTSSLRQRWLQATARCAVTPLLALLPLIQTRALTRQRGTATTLCGSVIQWHGSPHRHGAVQAPRQHARTNASRRRTGDLPSSCAPVLSTGRCD